MNRTLFRYLAAGPILVFVLSLIGCSNESGQTTEEVQLVQQTFDEQCVFCHGPGRDQDVAEVHSGTDTLTFANIAVTIPNNATTGGRPTITFTVFNQDGAGVRGLTGFGFTIAKLIPSTNGDASRWQSYINGIEEVSIENPDWQPVGTTAIQATLEEDSEGELTDHGLMGGIPGNYTYHFSHDLSQITTANGEVLDVAYEPMLTHRFGIESPRESPRASGTFDFRPSDGETDKDIIDHRDIAVSASCNECHVQLATHGDHRVRVQYCVTCHNPGTTDAQSGNTVDLKVMIHKIHSGENLPSVEAGNPYIIYGFFNSANDFSEVVFPQDIRNRNCTKCHDGADPETPDGYNPRNVPTMEACGSCHDDVDFETGENHPGGVQSDNSECAECHEPEDIIEEHEIPEQVAAKRFEYNILEISNTGPGEFPVITFSVTDPTNADAPYDILTDPEFTAPFGNSRLAVIIGWITAEYNNTGSGSTPAQPISIDALVNAVDNFDGTYTVTSTVPIPADVGGGSGAVGMEGHPAVETIPGSSDYDLPVPVTSVVESFPITDEEAQDRRRSVDASKCNRCHALLSAHGGNRNNQTQICVICHNDNATDISERPADPADTADGKVEQAIDFKYLIHAIHGAQFLQTGVVVYGYGGSENDFRDVQMPSPSGPGEENLNLKNCEGCHLEGTFELPLDPNASPTTVSTENDLADPDDDVNITPTASTCVSCHDYIADKTHMAEHGASFDFVLFAPETSPAEGQSQVALCGPGPISAQPAGHTTRSDCCSCHGVQ
jgi:OmcA/MtrC family decaheme c-type cytochrome